MWRIGLIAICVVTMAGGCAAKPATLSGAAKVVDGDTISIKGKHIRLFGVDAFEFEQTCGAMACGAQAALAMTSLLQGNTVACERQDTDRYGRTVAICKTSAGVDLGQEMVRRGLAVAYRTYSLKYLPDETFAKQHRRGAWATGFQSPLQYRKDHPRD